MPVLRTPTAALSAIQPPQEGGGLPVDRGDLGADGAKATLDALLATGAPMVEALGVLAQGFPAAEVAWVALPWLRSLQGAVRADRASRGETPEVWVALAKLAATTGATTAALAMAKLKNRLSHTGCLLLAGELELGGLAERGHAFDWLQAFPEGMTAGKGLILARLPALAALPDGLCVGGPLVGEPKANGRTILISECPNLTRFPADLAARVDTILLTPYTSGWRDAKGPLRGLAAIGFPLERIDFGGGRNGEGRGNPPRGRDGLEDMVAELFRKGKP
jgi:hypothetical protein